MNNREMEDTLKGSILKGKWPLLEPYIRNSIHASLKKVADDNIAIGKSKLGGKPDMPPNQEWPKEESWIPLAFIGQINFAETKIFDKENLLPTTGIASFFYSATQEAWGFDPKDSDKFRVLFFDTSDKTLCRHEQPENIPDEGIFESCELTFNEAVSLPSCENEFIKEILSYEEYDAFNETFNPGRQTKLLGYADVVQDEMEAECAQMTNVLYSDTEYSDPNRDVIKKKKDQWRLLFQVDSEDKANMMWGDLGRLYYWIKERDLKERRFDKTWIILQCG